MDVFHLFHAYKCVTHFFFGGWANTDRGTPHFLSYQVHIWEMCRSEIGKNGMWKICCCCCCCLFFQYNFVGSLRMISKSQVRATILYMLRYKVDTAKHILLYKFIHNTLVAFTLIHLNFGATSTSSSRTDRLIYNFDLWLCSVVQFIFETVFATFCLPLSCCCFTCVRAGDCVCTYRGAQ